MQAPATFYVFANRIATWTRLNLEATGTLVSAAFALAVGPPRGTVMAWNTAATPHKDARAAYLSGSLDYLPYVSNPNHLGMMTPFASNVTTSYRVEHDAELMRRAKYSLLPSRLSAVYAFADLETCNRVAQRWNWPLDQAKRFRLAPHDLNRIARTNMGIISLARRAYPSAGLHPDTISALWHAYWSGAEGMQLELPVDGRRLETVSSSLTWEFLVEGCLEEMS